MMFDWTEEKMKESIIMINPLKVIEEIKFRKTIEVLGTYQSEEEYLDAMLAITDWDIKTDSEFPQ